MEIKQSYNVLIACVFPLPFILSAHYPGTYSDMDAMKSGKSLWASEDYSSFNDNVGAGYWARVSPCAHCPTSIVSELMLRLTV